MEPTTIALALISSLLIKTSDKASDKLSDAMLDTTGKFFKQLKNILPKTATSIELAKEPLNYGQALLEVETAAKTHPELAQAALAVKEAASSDPELMATINAINENLGSVYNYSKLAETIANLYQAPVNIQKQEFNF